MLKQYRKDVKELNIKEREIYMNETLLNFFEKHNIDPALFLCETTRESLALRKQALRNIKSKNSKTKKVRDHLFEKEYI